MHGKLVKFLKRIYPYNKLSEDRLRAISDNFLKSGGVFKKAKIGEYFQRIKTVSIKEKVSLLPKNPQGDYVVPALTAGTSNQGLSCYCKKEDVTILKNVISVASNGAAGTMFYQPNDFTVLQDAYAIEFKGKMLSSKEYLYLLIFLQKSASGRFDWSNKAYWEKVKDLDFYIPRIGDDIAFEYMERYIEELEAYLTATGLKDYKLTEKEEKALNSFNDVFDRDGGGGKKILS